MKPRARGPRRRAPRTLRTLADRLWAFRERLGFTQRQLGSQVGVGQATVSAWEKGVSQPSESAWILLEKALGLPRRAFLEGVGFRLPDLDRVAEGPSLEIRLPAHPGETRVMRISPTGLHAEALNLQQAKRNLDEAVRKGRPVWLVIG